MAYHSVFRKGLFNERVIAISGGGSGIGRCIAIELSHLGANVAIIGRNKENLLVTS